MVDPIILDICIYNKKSIGKPETLTLKVKNLPPMFLCRCVPGVKGRY